jgi:hypothetical protein
MKYELKDYLYSINQSKKNILNEDLIQENNYPPFLINKCFSLYIDTILYSNEMNKNYHLDKKLQYDFYINSLKPRKRYSPWIKKQSIENIELVQEYYGYSYKKAIESLNVLSNNDLKEIKKLLNKGGN